MIQTKLRVSAPDERPGREAQAIIPVNVPDLDEIRKFANELHARNVEFATDAVRERRCHGDSEVIF